MSKVNWLRVISAYCVTVTGWYAYAAYRGDPVPWAGMSSGRRPGSSGYHRGYGPTHK